MTSVTQASQTQFFSSDDRIKKFGLECTGPGLSDEILFKPGWTPGGEYIQKLTVRNVSGSLRKFKYKLPQSRYFSLGFPEQVTLSPGCFVCFDVVFRPLELGVFDDFISFIVYDSHDKGFRIPVRALLSNMSVVAPSGIDFGYCPTNQNTDMFFHLENVGEIDAPFEWDTPFPFCMTPAEGVVPAGQRTCIRVTIHPHDASVYVSQATCSIGGGVHDVVVSSPLLVTRLSAIGKYAYIHISESVVDFGEVTCGGVITREVVLQNRSVVPTEFAVVRVDADRDEVFSVCADQAMIPGQSEIFVKIKYAALAAGNFSEDRYVFRTPGGCEASLTCRAASLSPVVELTRPDRPAVDLLEAGNPINSFNFGDSEIGKAESRVFALANRSDRKVSFGFVCDADSVFKFSPISGVISSKNEVSIKVTFSPSKPINFYRRVFCLLEDCLPQFVDLLGSGYIRASGEVKERRPMPLRYAHVQAARNRSVAGLGHLSADELDALNEARLDDEVSAGLFAGVGRGGTQAMAVSAVRHPVTRSGESTRCAVAVAHEFFISGTDASSLEVVLSRTHIDFGYAAYNTSSEPSNVSMVNNSNSTVTVCWFVPCCESGDSAVARSPLFSIAPSTCDILPKSSQTFSVVFASKQSNRNSVTEAEAIVYFKNQRTFRLVNDATMTPPWNLQLRLSGHTFSTGQLLASVRIVGCSVRHGKIVFPCAYVGEAIFQTVVLENTSNLPAIFSASISTGDTADGDSTVFSVKPDGGQIAARGFMHLCLRFKPSTKTTHHRVLQVEVNGSEGPHLLLEGCGSTPFVRLPDIPESIGILPEVPSGLQGSFYMQPTSMGLTTVRTFRIQNCSRLPLRFEVALPSMSKERRVITVSPSVGVINGNQCALISIEFRPRKAVKSIIKMHVRVFPIGGVSNKIIDARQPGRVARPACVQDMSVSLVAPGEVGAVVFSPFKSTVPVQLVNTSCSCAVEVENVTNSDVYYELHCIAEYRRETNSLSAPPDAIISSFRMVREEQSCSLTCSAPSGSLPARSRKRISFVFHSDRAGDFTFKIYAMLCSLDSSGNPIMLRNETMVERRVGSEHVDLGDLSVIAVVCGQSSFPKLLFEDIRADSDCIISDIEQLWRQFSLSSLNFDLSNPLEDVVATVEKKKYHFNFTPKPQYSSTERISIQIRNHGSLPAHFHIHYPDEQELELEPWVEEEELTTEKIMQTAIIQKIKCFTISPLKRVLQPNETCILTLTYSYESLKYDGIHRLPLDVIIDQGKAFVIELLGTTIPVEKGFNPKKPISTKSISLKHALVIPFADQNNVCNLSPVCIGLSSFLGPEQRTELVNVSELEVSYEIDINAMDFNLTGLSHGQNLVAIENPKGVIPGLSSVLITWRFFPLEAIQYEFPLLIRYLPTSNLKLQKKMEELNATPTVGVPARRRFSVFGASPSTLTFMTMGCNTIQLTIRCLGYDPRVTIRPKLSQLGAIYPGSMPPDCQLIDLPEHEQPARLSAEALDFGMIPLGSHASRILIIRNRVASRVKFCVEAPAASEHGIFDLLSFTPKEGVIDGGSHIVINIKCSAEGVSKVFYERIKISVREILGEDSQSVSAKLMSLTDKGKGGKTSFKQKHKSVIVKSTASRRTQISLASMPAGRTATLPVPHVVEQEAFRQLSADSDLGYTGSSAAAAMGAETDSIASYHSRENHSISFSYDSAASTAGAIKMQSSFPGGISVSRGGLKKVGTSEYGPVCYLCIRIRGEFHYWDVLANILVKAKAEGRINEYLISTRHATIARRVVSPVSASSSLDIIRPMSDKAIAARIKSSKKEHEVRLIAEYVMGDLFRSLMNLWDIGPHLMDAVTTPSAGLRIDSAIDKPFIGNPVYGLFFDEVINVPFEQKFVMEVHYALGTAQRLAPPSVGFLSEVEKARLPNIWISNETAALSDRKSRFVTRDQFYQALVKMNFSPKGAVYRWFDEMIRTQPASGNSINLFLLLKEIPNELVRPFSRTIDAATRKRRAYSKTLLMSPERQSEIVSSSSSVGNTTVVGPPGAELCRRTSAAIILQSALRADKAKNDLLTLQDKKIEIEAKMALAERVGFSEIMAEMLNNTIFNIIDEASFGEFAIDAEPLRFAFSRQSTSANSS